MRRRSGYNLRTVASAIQGLLNKRARVRGIEKQQRRAFGDPGKHQNFIAANFMFAGERNFGNAEPQFVSGRVANILNVLENLRAVATFDCAIANAGEQQHRGSR